MTDRTDERSAAIPHGSGDAAATATAGATDDDRESGIDPDDTDALPRERQSAIGYGAFLRAGLAAGDRADARLGAALDHAPTSLSDSATASDEDYFRDDRKTEAEDPWRGDPWSDAAWEDPGADVAAEDVVGEDGSAAAGSDAPPLHQPDRASPGTDPAAGAVSGDAGPPIALPPQAADGDAEPADRRNGNGAGDAAPKHRAAAGPGGGSAARPGWRIAVLALATLGTAGLITAVLATVVFPDNGWPVWPPGDASRPNDAEPASPDPLASPSRSDPVADPARPARTEPPQPAPLLPAQPGQSSSAVGPPPAAAVSAGAPAGATAPVPPPPQAAVGPESAAPVGDAVASTATRRGSRTPYAADAAPDRTDLAELAELRATRLRLYRLRLHRDEARLKAEICDIAVITGRPAWCAPLPAPEPLPIEVPAPAGTAGRSAAPPPLAAVVGQAGALVAVFGGEAGPIEARAGERVGDWRVQAIGGDGAVTLVGPAGRRILRAGR